MESIKNYQAVIFDVDGLLLDTERIYIQSFQKACQDFNHSISHSDYLKVVGRSIPDFEKIMIDYLGDEELFHKIHQTCRDYITVHFEELGIPLKPGSQEIISLIDELGLKKAIATSAGRVWAERKMRITNLNNHFTIMVTGNDVTNGKPSPDIFLKAAAELKCPPEKIIVLEDSDAGIRAAHAAGMTPIHVPDLVQPTKDVRSLSFEVCSSLIEARHTLRNLIEFNK